jgi:hypothetical protein
MAETSDRKAEEEQAAVAELATIGARTPFAPASG